MIRKIKTTVVKSAKLLVLLSFLHPFFSRGQELTQEVYSMKMDFSIIKEAINDYSLISSYYHGWHTFHLFNSTSTSDKYIEGLIQVRDFTILDGRYVYFCGTKYLAGDDDETNGKDSDAGWSAVMGCFLLDDLINKPVSGYVNLTYLESFGQVDILAFQKLEAVKVNQGVHVFMTGIARTGQAVLVDATASTPIPSAWNVNIDISTMPNELYDDVAVTDNYVYLTSRISGSNNGYITKFARPTSLTTTIFSNLGKKRILYNINNTILIEACESDSYVIGTYSNQHMNVISGFNDLTPIYSITFPTISSITPTQQMRDMSYNPASHTLDVLMWFLEGTDTASVIWHFNQSTSSGGYNNAHVYHDDILHSIDCLRNKPNNTIASGRLNNPNVAQFLREYKHYIFNHESCTNSMETKIQLINHILQNDNMFPGHIQSTEPTVNRESRIYSTPVSVKCQSTK